MTQEEMKRYYYEPQPYAYGIKGDKNYEALTLRNRLQEHLKKLHISDIEPWTIYKVSGSWLFELQELLGE